MGSPQQNPRFMTFLELSNLNPLWAPCFVTSYRVSCLGALDKLYAGPTIFSAIISYIQALAITSRAQGRVL